MQLSELKGYGVAYSDLESLWPADVKARMKRGAFDVVRKNLGLWEGIRFALAYLRAHRRAVAMDLSDLRARGLKNQAFLDQQFQYLATYAALTEVVGPERAERISIEIMERTAQEPMLHSMPTVEEVKAAGEPLEVLRECLKVAPKAGRDAGCHDMAVVDEPDAVGMDVTWCVWLELARRMGVPDAAKANCHADDIVLPAYFRALGLQFERKSTLARGGPCCDFRYRRPSG